MQSDTSLLDFLSEPIKSLLQKGTLWQFWYLGSLIILYCLLPCLQRIVQSNRKKLGETRLSYNLIYFWIFTAAVSVTIQICSMLIGAPVQKQVIQTFRLWTWMQYFAWGGLTRIFTPLIIQKFSLKAHTFVLSLWTILVLIYQNWAGREILHNLHAEYLYDSIFTIIWLTVLFSWIMRLPLNDKMSAIISNTSSLIMGVYILHPLVIKAITHFVTITAPLMGIVLFIAVLTITFGVVYIMRLLPLKRCISWFLDI